MRKHLKPIAVFLSVLLIVSMLPFAAAAAADRNPQNKTEVY